MSPISIEATLIVAAMTALGYAVAFTFQLGIATFWGFPPEYIRVSPEWIVFSSLMLSGAALGVFRGSQRQRESGRVRKRRKLKLVLQLSLAILGLCVVVIAVWTVLRWPLGAVVVFAVGAALVASGAVDIERAKSPHQLPYPALLAAIGLLLVAATIGYGGTCASRVHFIVKGEDSVVVYFSGESFVTAPYSPATRLVSQEYRLRDSAESSRATLEWTETGVLSVLPPSTKTNVPTQGATDPISRLLSLRAPWLR